MQRGAAPRDATREDAIRCSAASGRGGWRRSAQLAIGDVPPTTHKPTTMPSPLAPYLYLYPKPNHAPLPQLPGGPTRRRPSKTSSKAVTCHYRRHGFVVRCRALLLQTIYHAPAPPGPLHLCRIDRHNSDLTRHTPHGFHSHIRSSFATMSVWGRQCPSRLRRARRNRR